MIQREIVFTKEALARDTKDAILKSLQTEKYGTHKTHLVDYFEEILRSKLNLICPQVYRRYDHGWIALPYLLL